MKILNFVNKYGMVIILFMVLILFFRTCGMNTKSERHNDYVKVSVHNLDSLINAKMNNINKTLEIAIIERKIEGLKNEKRMIQATDRKIVDYNRENEIEKEIKLLEKELNKLKDELVQTKL